MLKKYQDIDPQETEEWIESIEDTLEEHGYERTRFLLEKLIDYAQKKVLVYLLTQQHLF